MIKKYSLVIDLGEDDADITDSMVHNALILIAEGATIDLDNGGNSWVLTVSPVEEE